MRPAVIEHSVEASSVDEILFDCLALRTKFSPRPLHLNVSNAVAVARILVLRASRQCNQAVSIRLEFDMITRARYRCPREEGEVGADLGMLKNVERIGYH